MRKALLIGFCYPQIKDKLPGCSTDVPAMTKLLQTKFGYSSDQITQVNDSNKESLQTIVRNFLKPSPDPTQYLIYYSGHGTYNGKNDTTLYSSTLQPFRESEIISLINTLKSNDTIIFIVDACNAGTILNLPFCSPTTPNNNKIIPQASVINLSASRDDQLAYNIYDATRQGVYGALTKILLDQLTSNPNQSWSQLTSNINNQLQKYRLNQESIVCVSRPNLIENKINL